MAWLTAFSRPGPVARSGSRAPRLVRRSRPSEVSSTSNSERSALGADASRKPLRTAGAAPCARAMAVSALVASGAWNPAGVGRSDPIVPPK